MERKKRVVKSIAAKDDSAAEELKEHFRGPDTSSLTAFLLSLFSCSRSGVRCADDPVGSDLDAVSMQHVFWTVRRIEVESASQHSTAKGSHSQQRSCRAHGSDVTEDNDWQLITDNDLQDNDSSATQNQEEMVLPGISDISLILTDELRKGLCLNLPTLVRGCQWVLLYSTWKHGISLLTLYRHSNHVSSPCLLVAKDNQGTVFGALVSSPLNPTKKAKYQGTNETFVFTNLSSKLRLFHPTGLNRYFFLCTKDALAFGGGRSFALHLDGDLLRGSSGCSETFGNCCLAHAEEFTVKHVELWGFAHASKYVPQKAAFKEPEAAINIRRW